jgi:hypothetical protein
MRISIGLFCHINRSLLTLFGHFLDTLLTLAHTTAMRRLSTSRRAYATWVFTRTLPATGATVSRVRRAASSPQLDLRLTTLNRHLLPYKQVSSDTYAYLRYASFCRSLLPYNRSLLTFVHISGLRHLPARARAGCHADPVLLRRVHYGQPLDRLL